MKPILILTALLASTPALAQGYDSTREINALRDSARAQERQAESLRRIEQIQRDRANAEDRERRNAATMSRSNRRFDR